MCGIAGILNLRAGPPPEEFLVRAMLGTIRHRGPDQFGIYRGDQVALGNARLSIIDLGGGQQPISNEDQSLWIVFNGEIFNHVELRAELESKGHLFVTHCDTEVLLHLFEEQGPACLTKLNGQWAFAIWDERRHSLFLARDRLGVRPLFYALTVDRLLFGSEVKAIFTDPRVPRALDPAGLDQVFTYWSTIAPQTCFEGIHELPPGHFLVAEGAGIRVEQYWGVEFPRCQSSVGPLERPSSELRAPSLDNSGEAEATEALRELLTDAVRIRLRADVPVGAYLSGGLDSSTIAAIVRQLGVSHLDTFSIAFEDAQFDESEHQQKMARFLGTDHQVVRATHEEIGRVFPEVVWHAETALLRTAPAPMYLLSKLVWQRNYKVVLTGEGADELLAGYDIFKEAKVRRFWARQPKSQWRPLLLRRLYPDIANLNAAGGAYLRSFFGSGLTDTEDPAYSHAIRWRNTRRCCRFFSQAVRERISGAGPRRSVTTSGASAGLREPVVDNQQPMPASLLAALRSTRFSQWGPLEKAQYLEIQTFLSSYLLSSQGDRMGMANSVEGRFPFLDHRVVEFCCCLPDRMKLRVLRDKHILREMARSLTPTEILGRPKRPYRAPIQWAFFHSGKRGWIDEVLSESVVKGTGLFEPEAVSQLTAKAERGKAMGETDSMALVGILSTQLLHERFIRSFSGGQPIGPPDDVKIVDRRRLAT